MKMSYEVNKKKLANIKTIDNISASIIINYYQNLFTAAKYLLRELFGVKNINVEFVNQEKYYQAVLASKFRIIAGNQEFTLILNDDELIITSPESSYTFVVNYDGTNLEASLKEFVVHYPHKSIVERFNSHKIELEIHFDNGKTCYFEIPIGKESIIDLDLCQSLNENSNIIDLRRFYQKVIYNLQTEYDHNKCLTAISIWQKIDNKAKDLTKGIKLDELTFKDGLINTYQLGNLYIKNDGKPIIVILKDENFTINFLEEEYDGPLDFNQILNNLIIRKKSLF